MGLIPFYPRSTITIAGPTQVGKTQFTYKILKSIKTMFSPIVPERILYCYGVHQPLYDEMKKFIPNITFKEGLPTSEDIDRLTFQVESSLLLVDDLMCQIVNNPYIEKLFTQGAHHRSMSIIYITQNVFAKGKCARTIALNTHYLILFPNLRDSAQIHYLGRQLYPRSPNLLIDAFTDATKEPYSYLLIDMHPRSDNMYRLRTNIFSEDAVIIYSDSYQTV